MTTEFINIGAGVLIGLALTSIYGIAATALRKRISIRSPESAAIGQLRPAVNAMIRTMGPMQQGIIAILEAQKGQCNGNVDAALDVNREAKIHFDQFLVESAQVEL